jgi:hypothetical protein
MAQYVLEDQDICEYLLQSPKLAVLNSLWQNQEFLDTLSYFRKEKMYSIAIS